MKAIILAGGFGTRLRPLSLSMPKPLIEFANKPMILHQIEALQAVGVAEIILATNYQPQLMLSFFEELEAKLGIKITCSQETEPLGTAGPLALAKDRLLEHPGEPFFVLNRDIICEFPLKQMLDFHQAHGGEVWFFPLLLHFALYGQVSEPSKYGVIVMDEKSGRVQKFVEKPEVYVGNRINAGIYLLNTSVLDRILLQPTSLERQVFPSIAKLGQLYAMAHDGFWMDVGRPKDYLMGLGLYLDYTRRIHPAALANAENIIGNVLIDETTKVGEGCLIGPDVVIGPNCVIESGVRLSSCALMKGVRVKSSAHVSGSIIGRHSTVGESARISGMAVLGEDVYVRDTMFLNGVVVLPHKEIKTHFMTPEIVM